MGNVFAVLDTTLMREYALFVLLLSVVLALHLLQPALSVCLMLNSSTLPHLQLDVLATVDFINQVVLNVWLALLDAQHAPLEMIVLLVSPTAIPDRILP